MYRARSFGVSWAQAGWIRATSSTTPCTCPGAIVGTLPITSPVVGLLDSSVFRDDCATVARSPSIERTSAPSYSGDERSALRHRRRGGRGAGRSGRRGSGGRAAGGADAAADARRDGRAGAHRRGGIGAAGGDRIGAAAQRDPLRAAGGGEDD